MNKRPILVLLFLLFAILEEIRAKNQESSLKRLLFLKYDRSTRPVDDYTTPTPVAVSTMILSLTKVVSYMGHICSFLARLTSVSVILG